MANVCNFATGTWKVFKPDGVSVFSGSIVYSNRAGGTVTYTMAACDATNMCAGIWEGEVEYLDCMGAITRQSPSFGFKIEESF